MLIPCVIDEVESPAILSCPVGAMDMGLGEAGATPSLPIPSDNEPNPKALHQP
jgi:hypothetical protein